MNLVGRWVFSQLITCACPSETMFLQLLSDMNSGKCLDPIVRTFSGVQEFDFHIWDSLVNRVHNAEISGGQGGQHVEAWRYVSITLRRSHVLFTAHRHWHVPVSPLTLRSCCLPKAVFRHGLQRMSTELGPDFLQSLPFTHEQCSRGFSLRHINIAYSNDYWWLFSWPNSEMSHPVPHIFLKSCCHSNNGINEVF